MCYIEMAKNKQQQNTKKGFATLTMKYMQKDIALRIKKEREALGITKEEFAEMLGVNRNTITAFERTDGKGRIPQLGDILNMCNLFNCEKGYLLCEYDCKTRENTDIQKATGLSESTISEIFRLSGNYALMGNRFLNTLFEAGFGLILADLQDTFYSYIRAKKKEEKILKKSKREANLYALKLNKLVPSDNDDEPGFTMHINPKWYLDLRLKQIGEEFNHVVKVICKHAYKNDIEHTIGLYTKVVDTYRKKMEEM